MRIIIRDTGSRFGADFTRESSVFVDTLRNFPRVIAYIWVAPVTAGAIGLVLLGIATGGRARIVLGVIEVHGGLVGWYLRRGMPWFGPAAAMTLGHVILGRDADCLATSREHEHVHVRQYERWGAL